MLEKLFECNSFERLQCTGYGKGNGSAYLANVQTIAYDTNYVYIQSTGIPSYRYKFILLIPII